MIVYNDKQWQSFSRRPAAPILRDNPKFASFAGRAANIDMVYGELARIFETRTDRRMDGIADQGRYSGHCDA